MAVSEKATKAAGVYFVSAQKLAFLETNWNLASVADISHNQDNPAIGVRFFREIPETITTFVHGELAIQTTALRLSH